jgi:hypothetical protein
VSEEEENECITGERVKNKKIPGCSQFKNRIHEDLNETISQRSKWDC